MMQDNLKAKRETNIRLLQRRIEELANKQQVQYSSEEEGEAEESPLKPTQILPQSVQNFNAYDEALYASTEPHVTELVLPPREPRELFRETRFGRPNNLGSFSSRKGPEPVPSPTPQADRQVIEELLKQLDTVKEEGKQKDLKVETLSFRCEQLQNELSLKIDQLNKTNLELEEQRTAARTASAQMRQLETQAEQTKRNLLPELQRLKSQNSVCLIEIRSLENDAGILEERIQELNKTNSVLKMENREVKALNSRLEQERLQIKLDVEALRAGFAETENNFEDLREENSRLGFENERLKNELAAVSQKLGQPIASKPAEKLGLYGFERTIDDLKRTVYEVVPTPKSIGSLYNKNDGRKQMENNFDINRPISRHTEDKLSFDGLNLLEDRLKKIIK